MKLRDEEFSDQRVKLEEAQKQSDNLAKHVLQLRLDNATLQGKLDKIITLKELSSEVDKI